MDLDIPLRGSIAACLVASIWWEHDFPYPPNLLDFWGCEKQFKTLRWGSGLPCLVFVYEGLAGLQLLSVVVIDHIKLVGWG